MHGTTLVKPTVLAVDDDKVMLSILELRLRAAGYTVILANSAERALGLLRARAARIVISDWMMPGMDGLQFVREVRALIDSPLVYFIMLTGHTEKQQLVEAFDAGVDDFLTKPFDESELLARLRAASRILDYDSKLRYRADLNEELNARLSHLNTQLLHASRTDELTGLPNRREAMERLQHEWSLANRHGHPLSCAMIDVDSFKRINDQLGHARGDEVLNRVGGVLRATLRTTDGVYRLGGDEFLLLMPHTDVQHAAETTDRCRRELEKRTVGIGFDEGPVTMSVGVAEKVIGMHRAEDLVLAADHALYDAKHQGRNNVSAVGYVPSANAHFDAR